MSYDHYELRVEYRFVGEQVAGRAGLGAAQQRRDDPLAVGRFDGARPGVPGVDRGAVPRRPRRRRARPTANLCTPGTHVVMDGELVTDHCIEAASETYDGDQLGDGGGRGPRRPRHPPSHRRRRRARVPRAPRWGASSCHKASRSSRASRLTRGHIALQAESHPVEFRQGGDPGAAAVASGSATETLPQSLQ